MKHPFLFQRFVCVLSCWISLSAYAYEPQGWLWHDMPIRQEIPKKEKDVYFEQLNADEQVAVLRAYTLSAIHAMDIDPTPEHAKMAAEWLQFWSGKATHVMQSYRQMLLENPDLDYHLTHPTESAALSIRKKIEASQQQAAIESLSQRYGIFYFYEGHDPYEKALSPIIQHFSERYHVSVVPISVDGVFDDQFANSRADNGQAAALQVTHFPAIILVNPQTHESKPLHYGFISEEALANQFYQVATNFKGEA